MARRSDQLFLGTIWNNKSEIKKCCSSDAIINGTISVLQFRIGDGGIYTPLNGTTIFNPIGNPLTGKQIIAVFAANTWVPPMNLVNTSELSWSASISTGIITLFNGTFNTDTIYSILYE